MSEHVVGYNEYVMWHVELICTQLCCSEYMHCGIDRKVLDIKFDPIPSACSISLCHRERVSVVHFLRTDKMLAYIHTSFVNDRITGFIFVIT